MYSFSTRLLGTLLLLLVGGVTTAQEQAGDRSPVELFLTADESHLLTINQTSATVSLVGVAEGRVLAELVVGAYPVAGALFNEDRTLAVACAHSGELRLITVDTAAGKLTELAMLAIGMEPQGVAIDEQAGLAYVSQWAGDAVAIIDLAKRQVAAHIPVPGQPRTLALAPNGKRLAVAVDAQRGLSVIDLEKREVAFTTSFAALNIGAMTASLDSQYVYFPWMVYRANPITRSNIRRGWVLASRLARQRLDVDERREAFSLDPEGRAVADPYAVALGSNGKRIVVTSPGTHELLVFAADGLPWESRGSTDHIVQDLLDDSNRFSRIELGGRPMGVKLAADSRTAYVANYLHNSVQMVDMEAGKVLSEIPLGGPVLASSARRGEAIFYDAKRSFEQWYSCHSCHRDGGGNVMPMDTVNDGSNFSYKTVLPLYNVANTAPWTWHGWQTDLPAAMRKSLTDTMLGPEPTEQEVDDLLAYFATLAPPPNSHRTAAAATGSESLMQRIARGKQLFQSNVAGCTSCHTGEYFTDGQIHDVGTGGAGDRYEGYNTPSLIGVYRKARFLHNGAASSLEEVLTGEHAPQKIAGERELTAAELADLIAYLKTL